MSELHLACAADPRYVAHSAAMLHSAIVAGDEGIVVHYLHGAEMPRNAVKKLQSMFGGHPAEIRFHEIGDPRLARLPMDDQFGAAMWYRVLLPELLGDVGQVLYLDIDTLVQDQLEPLWQVDLDGCYLGAVTNVCLPHHRDHPTALGLDPADYFNSGVLMLNLELMRREDFTERLLKRIAADRGTLTWPDQDALNLLAASRRRPLHPRWNSMNSLVTARKQAIALFGATVVDDAVDAPAIRHFEGPDLNKPWHVLHDQAGQDLYRNHRRQTPWPEYLPDGAPRGRPLERVWTRLWRRESARTSSRQ